MPPTVSGTATEAQVRELRRKQHQAIRKVHQDLEGFAFNTMISALMEYANYLWRAKETPWPPMPPGARRCAP